MGLDMYLSAKRYLWSDEDKAISEGIEKLLGVESDHNARFHGSSLVAKEVSLEAMYWRKANAIHGWFVENCQDGEDNCQEYWVSREKLINLKDLCQDILEHPDDERDTDLDPTEGFFFGSYEKDDWYYKDLENTVRGLERALSLPDSYEFYYRASW